MRKTRAAFTLLELALVATLMVIIGTIGVVYLNSENDSNIPVQAAADTVKTVLADAKSRATTEGRAYRFEYLPEKRICRVIPEGETADDAALETEIPEQIQLDGKSDACVITFLPDGSCRRGDFADRADDLITADDNVEITFRGSRGYAVTLKVRAANGTATVTAAE